MLELNTIICDDCLDAMRKMEDNCVDTVITDPPYGLKFMGKKWDYEIPSVPIFSELLRVAKPGAIILCFGGTRTWHRIAVNIEDAGWEIRDTIMWVYGSGFPKSLDISKAIDKVAGAEREVVGVRTDGRYAYGFSEQAKRAMGDIAHAESQGFSGDIGIITNPFTQEAKTWNGYGTALKPAFEPIILAMKPLDGTYAENATKWGVAGLNIDGSRVEYRKGDNAVEKGAKRAETPRANIKGGNLCNYGGRTEMIPSGMTDAGRWPANILHDGSDEVLAVFPNTISGSGNGNATIGEASNNIPLRRGTLMPRSDSGSAARFFYCAKASRSEREYGLEGIEPGKRDESRKEGNPGGDNPRNRGVHAVRNVHPTVKPLALVEYLCTLTKMPTGGIVLDPFIGSGTTAIAALRTGRNFLGIEISEEYCNIANKRIMAELVQEKENKKPQQLNLF